MNLEKAKNVVKKAVRFGKALVGGTVGLLLAICLAVFVVALAVVIAVGALTIPAMATLLIVHFLGLSTGWAIAVFLALVWFLWGRK